MRSQISPCISSCRWSGGPPPKEILKTKNAGKAISGHFAIRLTSQIYLNYVFEVGHSSSVGCTYRLVSKRSRIRSSRPEHSFVEIWSWKKKSTTILSFPLIQERQLSVTGEPRVRSPRPAHSFVETWSWKHFYGHSSSSADSRRAVVSYWQKNVH